MRTLLAGVAMAVLICGCGGGGSSAPAATPPPPPTPPPAGLAEGLWVGTTSNGRAVVGLVLDDGTYWVLYALVGNSSQIAGVVQGTGTSQNGTFSSSNGKDFNFEGAGVMDITFGASYVAKQSLNATIQYSGTTVSLPATYRTDYELTPSLSITASDYYGYAVTTAGPEYATATISPSGAITGVSVSGCSFSGSTSPRTHGNAYNVSVTFAGGVCANGSSTVTGVGYFDAGTNNLYGAALNAARTNGFLFVGTKGTDQSGSIISAFTDAILIDEKSGFEQDETAIDHDLAARGLYQSGVHVAEYKANLIRHVQSSFDRQVAEIVVLSRQQTLSRSVVVPLVYKLREDWQSFMQQKTTTHIGAFIGGSVLSQTIAELEAAINNIGIAAVSQLDSRVVWSP